jgi:hypothetical protein
MLGCIICTLTGCVRYKYSIHPDGTQIQMGSYIQDRDFYMRSHFKWTKTGKELIQANKEVEEYYRTNIVGDKL